MSLIDNVDSLFDWSFRPDCLADSYFTMDQQKEIFDWLTKNRETEREKIFYLIKEGFDWSNIFIEDGYENELHDFNPDILISFINNILTKKTHNV